MRMGSTVEEQILPGDLHGSQEFDPPGGFHEPMFVTAVMNIGGIEAEVAGVKRACVPVQGCGVFFIGYHRHIEEHFKPSFRPSRQTRNHYSPDSAAGIPDFSNTRVKVMKVR
jgi:hypothetical protein